MAHCDSGVIFAPSLKANAYGHGLVQCASALSALAQPDKKRVYAMGLARISEVLELRRAGFFDRVLLYSHATRDELHTLFSAHAQHGKHGAHHNVEFVVGSECYLRDIALLAQGNAQETRVHLKCDTGMGRLGVLPKQFEHLYRAACATNGVCIAGVCTHFSATDDETVRNQWSAFASLLPFLQKPTNNTLQASCTKQHEGLIVHAANSGGVLWNCSTHGSMVRPGIALYGAHPQPNRRMPQSVSLLPVMEVRSHVANIKKIPKNHGVSYASMYKPQHDTHIAVVNAGYGDGIPICLSNRGAVRIRGRTYPIVGRICMDMLMVDIGAHANEVKCGDEVLLWGGSGLSVDEQATCARTISYELLCGVGNNYRVEKVFVE